MLIKPTHIDISQNSEDWDILRCGKLTASMFGDLFAKKETKTYQDVITKVAFERVVNKQQINFSTKWMEYGHETEPEAAENYCIETFNEVENAGFWQINDFVGASPDRKIVAENGGCEFKCPSFSTYREYLSNVEKHKTVKLPSNYYWQVHGQLLCTGWDYIDYMPYVSPNLKQILTRVYRDESILLQLIEKIKEALEDVNILVDMIKR